MRAPSLLIGLAIAFAGAGPSLSQNLNQNLNQSLNQSLNQTPDQSPAPTRDDVIAPPVLRASVTVTSDLVLIGDVIDNAGSAGKIAIYRAPDLGTTGALPTAKLLAALRAHQVIGVETRDIREVSVTRLARTVAGSEIETQVARALAQANGRAEAGNFEIRFDREPQTLQLDPSNSGAMEPVAVRHDPRSGRFDVTFEIPRDGAAQPTKLRFTGTAIETVEAAVLVRGVERNEVLKSSDVVVERRPKTEVGNDVASRDAAVGMQARRQLRAGQALRIADLAKPDLVSRDQAVTLIYESTGLYLTVRGKAVESGTEGDVVNVMNLQSKRTVAGTVIGRGQVAVQVAAPRMVASAAPIEAPVAAPTAVKTPASRQPE
ncbi:flagella basal body P-ring formation protein FlgA [Rhodopseudomonas rhenobacensis]|uniref:Flagella basal body P-ring formation protein FlgA n=2 Tax=Rhodopseudomonas rhenobacensis TaxID=87461 RepID=A0A7W7Z3X4_9BRAD|nr:flagella basal body P-ring formation protein FlgA [Rhodopseudomonas rhenobacensis]